MLVGKSGSANERESEESLRSLLTRSLGAGRALVRMGRMISDITVLTNRERIQTGDGHAVEVEVGTEIGRRVGGGGRGEARRVTRSTLGGVTRGVVGNARRRGTGTFVVSRKRSESLEKARGLKIFQSTPTPIPREFRTRKPLRNTVIGIATVTGKTILTTAVNTESTRNEARTDTDTTRRPTNVLPTQRVTLLEATRATGRNIVTAAIGHPVQGTESLEDPSAISSSRTPLM